MLYLHCGWPRTSTTTLQGALYEHRDGLAAAGVLFPETWLSERSPTHNGLAKVLKGVDEEGGPLDDFRRFLASNADRHLILSAEFITTWVLDGDRHDPLLRMLAVAREITPTRCIWTLRRFDDGLRSLYLRRLGLGYDLPPAAMYFARIRNLHPFFAGMRRIEESLDGEVSYIRYRSSGAHNLDLLDAFDIPVEARAPIERRLVDGPRLNASITHKQACVLLHVDAVEARAGTELDREAVHEAFHLEEFQFEDDWRCDLVDGAARQALHEHALEAAQTQGFAPYGDFFSHSEPAAPASVRIDPDELTDGDLERLAARFGRARVDAGASV